MSLLIDRARSVQRRCKNGTTSYHAGNDLHADCHQLLGELLTEVQRQDEFLDYAFEAHPNLDLDVQYEKEKEDE